MFILEIEGLNFATLVHEHKFKIFQEIEYSIFKNKLKDAVNNNNSRANKSFVKRFLEKFETFTEELMSIKYTYIECLKYYLNYASI